MRVPESKLAVEHEKTELCHFSRKRTAWTALDLGEQHYTGEKPAATLQHLGFYLDSKFTFREHVGLYGMRGPSTAQSMLMLGNSVRGMTPAVRRKLYQ